MTVNEHELMQLAKSVFELEADDSPPSSTHMATVLRTDNDGTIWVSIAGGADETPCVGTYADARPGDTVKVEIANGRATVIGNAHHIPPVAGGKETDCQEQQKGNLPHNRL